MINISFLTESQKKFFNLRVKTTVFFHFLKLFLNWEIKPSHFIRLLKRLNYFLFAVQHNKFVKIGKGVKIDLYVPPFPSPAFFQASRKFLAFDKMMPCTTVLVSVTSACRYNCPHCYQKLDKGKDVDLNILIPVIKNLQNKGIVFFNIEGGEPFLVFDRLKTICQTIDERSEIWINSTGDGMTIEKLKELKQPNISGIMFSLHSPYKAEFNQFMGEEKAWDTMINGIKLCHEAGYAPAINTCLTKQAFSDGRFEKIMEITQELNIALIQIIKPKPSGGYLSGLKDDFTNEDFELVKKKVNSYNLDKDKNYYPSISAQIMEEDKSLFGCTAGGTDRFYINAKGDVQPCEFINISYGNIAENDFDEIYEKMRSCFTGGGDCWLCEKYSGQIKTIYDENNLNSLPLSPDKSKDVYEKWNRGEQSDFYKKIRKL